METQGALFFYDKKALVKEKFPQKPVKVLFITSIRDIVLEEYNGQFINLKNENNHYVKGVIEKTLEETKQGGVLEDLIEVVGVIVDDTDSDLNGKFPLLPGKNKDWIYPKNLLSVDCVWNIQSLFRKLPKNDIDGREKSKYDFELQVFEKAQEVEADIIILDGYMARLEHLQTMMNGKVINIHPAPAIIGMPYCFRGKDEVMDAIRFAQANGGIGKTGATLHFVNSELDDGKPIAYICDTFVSGNDTEVELLCRNYVQAKLPIFIAGLRHFVLKIFPYL